MPSAASMAQKSYQPIIERASSNGPVAKFNPKEHISFKPPPQIITMEEIGYKGKGISPIAVSQPFQLFSEEAVHHMRDEILNPDVMDNCSYRSNIAACQLRGYVPKYAPFTYDAWTNPETLGIISHIAGVDLIPAMNFEIGNINFSVKSEKQTKDELAAIAQERSMFANDEGIAGCPWEDDKPVVGWHTDSYPFVCVLMMSDCTNMVGGETALATGNGDILKVRGPQMGCAVILQGRYISHQALRALGAQERITSVTSFRPRSPFVKDDTVLTTVRPVSDLNELYSEFAEYRMDIMEQRIRAQLRKLRDGRKGAKKIDTKSFKEFLKESEDFFAHTNRELVEEDKVTQGFLENADDNAPAQTGGPVLPPEPKTPSKRARVD